MTTRPIPTRVINAARHQIHAGMKTCNIAESLGISTATVGRVKAAMEGRKANSGRAIANIAKNEGWWNERKQLTPYLTNIDIGPTPASAPELQPEPQKKDTHGIVSALDRLKNEIDALENSLIGLDDMLNVAISKADRIAQIL
jgi:hypothetical protein